ncbi:hypothetical protein QJS04_geneDACA017786 [Acorus gramineus]|uniref:Uncharacterized protein n=1 Tax=Acorus gramineus TaxID=55184 RepID=A0AAV9BYG2_ACOGR|nr:hypothetical protein QJS04_geneDACA017786 [Acorus gramineus]
MHIVAMKLHNPNSPSPPPPLKADAANTWQPSKEGFLKYLIDSHLVFRTINRIVDESSHVTCKCSMKCYTQLWVKCLMLCLCKCACTHVSQTCISSELHWSGWMC